MWIVPRLVIMFMLTSCASVGTSCESADSDSVLSGPKSKPPAAPPKVGTEPPSLELDRIEGEPLDVFPRDIKVAETRLALNGSGLCEFGVFKIDVYWAALYAREPSRRPEDLLASSDPLVLHMRFARGLSKENLGKAWRAATEANAGESFSAYEGALEILEGMMTPVEKGDAFVFVIDLQRGLSVYLGSKFAGTIEDLPFTRLFLGFYLGDNPPDPNLKSGLLGR